MQASEIQVGTHVLQALCGDAKFRKDTRVTDKVPAVKRAVERFTILVRDLLQGASWCSVPWSVCGGCVMWRGVCCDRGEQGGGRGVWGLKFGPGGQRAPSGQLLLQ